AMSPAWGPIGPGDSAETSRRDKISKYLAVARRTQTRGGTSVSIPINPAPTRGGAPGLVREDFRSGD
ncbi:unnamed protein product, partial [marine sediment metagenome]